MATHDIDQKILGSLAKQVGPDHPAVSSALFQILGLSILLSRRLHRARKMRRHRDIKSLALYHHIIWLSREGLQLTEIYVYPFAEQFIQRDAQLKVFAQKLRGTFYYILSMFGSTGSPAKEARIPLGSQEKPTAQQDDISNTKSATPPRRTVPDRAAATLRDPIPSMISEASYITNPYSPPPGLFGADTPDPATAVLSHEDLVTIAHQNFDRAILLAAKLLPGSAPLRLSVALEYSTFLWECKHDGRESRAIAREAIADVYRAPEGMDDGEFEDASALVEALGRAMRRKSGEDLVSFGDS